MPRPPQSYSDNGYSRRHETSNVRVKPRKGVVTLTIVVAILIACAAVVWFVKAQTPTIVTYTTPVGPQQQFELQDGIRVTLNTNSKIAARIDDEHRDVEVLAGEVFFDVVHNPRRPLRVCAAGHLFADLGTQFNARVSSSGTIVTVRQGEVDVRGRCKMDKNGDFASVGSTTGGDEGVSDKASAIITSGEQVSIVDGGAGTSLVKRKLTRSQMDNLLAWQDGLLIFENAPLPEVLEQINRYFPQPLEIADSSLLKVRVSGMYRNSAMDSILRALEESHGIVELAEDKANPGVIRLGRIKTVAQDRSGSRGQSP
jgi:transmembrane sensor